MTTAFIDRLATEGTVDTRKYRYVYRSYWTGVVIRRIPIGLLDTTAALDAWETVYDSTK